MIVFDSPPAIIRPAAEEVRRFGNLPDLSFLPGVAVAVPRPKIKFEATDISSDAANASSYSFTSQAIGEAAADRLVIVSAFTAGGTGVVVSSIAIDGSAGSSVADAATASTSGRMAARIIPSGTTITIDVTCTGGNAGRCQIAVCTLKQYRLASAFDTFAEGLSDAVTTHVGSVDIPGNGIGIYMAMRNSSTTSSWSGASELLSQNVPAEAQRTSLAASYSPGVPRDATVTWGNTGHRVMLAASWR